MDNSRYYPLFILALLLVPSFSNAQVFINEVLYSPVAKQWIEIYNNTDSPIDLTQYKILDNGAPSNGHGITSVMGGNLVPAHGYGVVSKLPDDFASAAYPVFKASLGIKTSGDTVALKSGSTVADSISVDSSAVSGNSLQKSDSGWISAAPTPGAINATTPATTPPADTSTDATTTDTNTGGGSGTGGGGVTTTIGATVVSSHYSYLPLSAFNAAQVLAVSAGRNRLATVGNPIEFQGDASIDDGTVAYTWNFGDGTLGGGKKILHVYAYPGEYVVVLSATSASAKAVSRTQVSVTEPKFKIASANGASIQVINSSTKEANLYGWQLAANGKTFVFPQDTIILPGASISFSSGVTSLYPAGAQNVSIVQNIQDTAPTTSAALPTDPVLTTAKRDELYKELLSLSKVANDLARAQAPKSQYVGNNTSPDKAKIVEVATPILAFGSATATATTTSTVQNKHTWLTVVRRFFGM